MKFHHQFCHAFDTIRTYNLGLKMVEFSQSLLKDQSPDGTALSETLENLKAMVTESCDGIAQTFSNIQRFIDGHDTYDLTEFSDKSLALIGQDKTSADSFSSSLKTAISAPAINTKTKLASISSTVNLTYASPVAMYPLMQYTCILNDWLDASAYIFRGIDFNNGGVKDYRGTEKDAAKGMLNQFPNLTHFKYPLELQPEVDAMIAVKNFVLGKMDGMPLKEMADYIDANIEKLPLMRRSWAIG